jgi:hypothetical protein
MSPGRSEELPGRHDTAGLATVGLASDTLSRAALRARHGARASYLVPLIGFCQSNEPRAHHEHLQPRRGATGQPLLCRVTRARC